MKTCSKCKETKESSQFYKLVCKPCKKKQTQENLLKRIAAEEFLKEKTCTVCSQTKEVSLFIKGKNICKSCNSGRCKKYQSNNKDKMINYRKENYQANKEKIKADRYKYVEENREKANACTRASYQKKKELYKSNARVRWHKNAEHNKSRRRNYYKSNKQYLSDYNKNYRKENKKELRAKYRAWQREKYNNCPRFNLIERLRKRTRAALQVKGIHKTKRTLAYLGCTAIELQAHIESLFKDGMSWENKREWHIDHIIPISSGNTEEEILKLNHYTNLQPLWALENILKSDKIITPHKEEENEY